jgi:hypothetical protein
MAVGDWMKRIAAAMLVVLAMSGAARPSPAPVDTLAAWTPSNGDRLVFDVYRDGGKFGSHTVAFARQGGQLTVETDIELKVALGPITLFHYVHDATERWIDGRLAGVNARTKSDGKWKTLTAEATQNGLKVAGAAFNGVLTGETIPSTHWNLEQMRQAAMLSTETGEMLPTEIIDQGVERVKTANGEIEARRILVRSEMDATFWYDEDGRWVKCAFRAQGSNVEYVLREPAA